MTSSPGDPAAVGGHVSVSVVIAVARRDYPLIARQLGQLARQVRGTPDFEVVIGDNDGELETQRLPVAARLVDASDRRGAAHARNLAAAAASGDLLLFCDADDLVGPEWVRRHVLALRSCDLTAGALRVVDIADPLIDDVVSSAAWPREGFSTRHVHHEGVPIAPSNNMGLRREAFLAAGGFPIDYLRSQDVALSLALRAEGSRPTFVPEAQVLYVTGRRTGDQRRKVHREIGASRARLHQDFGVGPSPGRLILRAAGRTARAAIGPVLPRPPARPPGDELAELAGLVSHVAGRPSAVRSFRRAERAS